MSASCDSTAIVGPAIVMSGTASRDPTYNAPVICGRVFEQRRRIARTHKCVVST